MVGSILTNLYNSFVLQRVEGIKNKIDPISVLALVALLRYKESMTRIHLEGYSIKAQQPSEYQYGVNLQGIVRTFQQASREDLDVIHLAIQRGAKLYQPQIQENSAIRNLYSFVIEGLDALKASYTKIGSGVTTSAIEEWKISARAFQQISNNPNNTLLGAIEEKVKHLWVTAEIEEVNSLLEQMKSLQGTTPPDNGVNCKDEIERLELMIAQKARRLEEIYTNLGIK